MSESFPDLNERGVALARELPYRTSDVLAGLGRAVDAGMTFDEAAVALRESVTLGLNVLDAQIRMRWATRAEAFYAE